MSTPYIGEIRTVGFPFAPVGWALCDGQLLSIAENDALFNLIGTTYGGDGQNTFALPNLQGKVPLHMGQGAGLSSYVIGEEVGVETITLQVKHLPSHSHYLQCVGASADTKDATLGVYAVPLVAGHSQDFYSQDGPYKLSYTNGVPVAGTFSMHLDFVVAVDNIPYNTSAPALQTSINNNAVGVSVLCRGGPLPTPIYMKLLKPGRSSDFAVVENDTTGCGIAISFEGTNLASNALQAVGASQPHDNMQPYLTINFIIALEGIYPTQ